MSQRQDDFGRTDHGAPQASPTAPKAEAQEGMSIKGFTGLFANPDQINHRHNLPAHTRLIDLSGPVPEGIFYHPKHEGKPKYTFPTKKVPKEQGSLHFPPEFADDDIPFGMDEPVAETAALAPTSKCELPLPPPRAQPQAPRRVSTARKNKSAVKTKPAATKSAATKTAAAKSTAAQSAPTTSSPAAAHSAAQAADVPVCPPDYQRPHSDDPQTDALNEEALHNHCTIVRVGINRALYDSYDYKLAGYHGPEILGARVEISFGRGSGQKEVGIIVGLGATSPYKFTRIKPAFLLDSKPLILPDIYATMEFAARYYHYPLGQTMPLALPKLLRDGGSATYKEIPGLKSKVAPADLEASLKKLRSQSLRDLLLLLQQGPVRSRALREQGFSAQQEATLVRRNLAARYDFAQEREVLDLKALAQADERRAPAASAEFHSALLAQPPLKLNAEQQAVLDVIVNKRDHGVFLLNGVTGSGKTEVYLQAIEATLRRGQKALVLVPEIALTPQTFRRFYQRFKVPIATMHSNLSNRERLDAFLDMYYNRAAILIGTRSALFTSIPDLGLIVIDEEHDASFKQGDGLRYHARTLAIYRAQLCHCPVILGSATPSLESIYNCMVGNYQRLDLLHRAKSSRMPDITLLDLRQEQLSDSVIAGLGTVLENAIGLTTALHNQAILFLNRRGFSHSMICHQCGHVIACAYCDNQMTVHRALGQLRCHICNSEMPIPNRCPYCKSEDSLVEIGVGTEQVESYLMSRFMDVGIERIDRDNITTKKDLDEALARIAAHKSEIIVGTQMLAKGHDFPDVTLVGILDVDSGLFCDDFRGWEYTAQLITQVAGRAGRADKAGCVYIQTRFPDHPLLINLVAPNFNYVKLAEQLLALRYETKMPPFTYQALVMANSLRREHAFSCLRQIFGELDHRPDLLVNISISPILPDRIEKRFNRFHFHVSITAADRQSLAQLLDFVVQKYQALLGPGDLRFAIDVDPINNP